ncbi:MAG: hypothetical protein PVI60_02095 [Desulfobacteraceae bacterium]|jgi:hypothetical protein
MLFINRHSVLPDPEISEPNQSKDKPGKPSTTAVGLDIGTASIISGALGESGERIEQEQNAFFTIPCNDRILEVLSSQNIKYFRKEGNIYVLGKFAEKAADIFKQNTRRPIKRGLLNPSEPDGIDAIMAILDDMIPADQRDGTNVFFSTPADPIDQEGAVVYHASVLEMRLKSMGLNPTSVNEGLAVIVSETDTQNATALGISVGGGMCNICFAYMCMPMISYGIQKGGDYIDERVAYALNETATHIKLTKEQSLDLSTPPKSRIDTALHIYYDDLFSTLARSLEKVLGSSDKTCRLPGSLPLIISGGTMLPKGSLEKFKKAMKPIRLPIKISNIVLASNPAEATMRGAMKMAAG